MARRNIVELSASKNVLWHDNDDGEESTLVSLLEEAKKLELKDSQLIQVGYEKIGKGSTDFFPSIVFKTTFMKYETLKELYRNWNGGEDYSPEIEKIKNDFEMEIYEADARRKAAWGKYLDTMNTLRVIEKESKRAEALEKVCGEKEREKLEKKWEKEDSPPRGNFVIL